MRSSVFAVVFKIIAVITLIHFIFEPFSWRGSLGFLSVQVIGFIGGFASCKIYDALISDWRGYSLLMKTLFWWACVDIGFLLLFAYLPTAHCQVPYRLLFLGTYGLLPAASVVVVFLGAFLLGYIRKDMKRMEKDLS